MSVNDSQNLDNEDIPNPNDINVRIKEVPDDKNNIYDDNNKERKMTNSREADIEVEGNSKKIEPEIENKNEQEIEKKNEIELSPFEKQVLSLENKMKEIEENHKKTIKEIIDEIKQKDTNLRELSKENNRYNNNLEVMSKKLDEMINKST